MKKSLPVILMLFAACLCQAQTHVNALFIGNSYTEVNNLPQMVQEVAASMGDELTWRSNTPGGCTFGQHCTNLSMNLIREGGWDVVVLQEQSQLPSFPQAQVEVEVFPHAQRLVDSVYAHSPCGEPMFYMTWGRKNGDDRNAEAFPVLGTYEGMDSMLCERYTYMAQEYDASLCPVGRVWRRLRRAHPDIELYQADGSHPSVAGSYAAACAFYVMMFHHDPDSITFSASLPAATAEAIRSAVRQVVFDDLARWQRPQPQAAFSYEVLGDSTVLFTATVGDADSLEWHFGDGTDTTIGAGQTVMIHPYSSPTGRTVTLTARRHCLTASDTHVLSAPVGIGQAQATADGFTVHPNPASGRLHIDLDGEAEAEVALYGMDGRLARRQTLAAPASLPLEGLPEGVYLLRCRTAKGGYSRKVTVICSMPQ